ncbi:uncharacterized protein BDR25DRAFT_279297 [Lindgomyces ingoldianus]|uniref:Uncharacterized protein n=1 Tax=Lindgomyces ingoldianus TaxID=673940 RepID=A0ACB6R938_9PLEO|nr:uncharacterized protein BDR25DRAFT_279297 [Lindgomyces ingoldianus]KAF2475283.1 hypothetical protein BDR25DRAFT_279297 [Lindgomyces ingoldianus]
MRSEALPSQMPQPEDPAPQEQHYNESTVDIQCELAFRTAPQPPKASSQEELSALSLLDVLQLDYRPTFIVDVSSAPTENGPYEPVYCNPSLAADGALLGKITRQGYPTFISADNTQQYSGYRSWLFSASEGVHETTKGNLYMFEGYFWSATSIGHYRVVSGVKSFVAGPDRAGAQNQSRLSRWINPQALNAPRNMHQTVQHRLPSGPLDTPIEAKQLGSTTASSEKHGPFDYTRDPAPTNMSTHIQYFRSVDWSQTPLGPMPSWSPQLCAVVNMVMNDTHPAVLFWGDSVTMVYNEAYIELIGALHPCMGSSARVAAREYWFHFQPLVDHINATGQTLTEHDLPLFLSRHGFLEETFFSFQFIPILDCDGYVAGYYQPLIETTKNNLLERRVSSLVEIGSQTAKARDLQTYWELVLNTLAINDKDAPFALLFSATHEDTPEVSSVSSSGSATDLKWCFLKGTIGVSANHMIAPSRVDLKSSSYVFNPYLIKAAKSRKPILLHFEELDMADGVLADIDWKGYGDPCRSVIFCPILPTTGEQVQGFLILGVNPRRPFDDDYQQFVHVLNRLLATSLASVVLFDEVIRQKENAIGQAAQIQEQLLAELKLKEEKFQRFAERSDVAIFIADMNGKYIYRNHRWFDIFKVSVDVDDVAQAWMNIVFPEDFSYCEGLFAKLVVDKTPFCVELRTAMPWTPPESSQDPESNTQEHFVWILCSAYPELGPNHELKEIVGNMTDISQQKWAEGVQKMRTDSALESKKHLEHFIDTTSHEMRNPLSAIMQCADGILASYSPPSTEFGVPSPNSYATLLDQTLDAAQTIGQCAQHMKRIVDDILTISKLDSDLLVITPIDAQPEVVVHHAVKMFEAEAKAAGVDMRFEAEQSYRDLQINWVSLDPTRLLQVLINLISNAIKFTRLERIRMITISVGASKTEPASVHGGVQFINDKLVAGDKTLKADWKRGPTIYLQFSVSDTGRGLSDDEKALLFERFSQASPRTHIHYGGSGLGLFISRRLTEMQGGAIGLASQLKKGSTFSFYVKGRRTTPSNPRRGSIPNIFPEDIKHRPHTSKEIDRSLNPTRPAMIRRHTFINPNVSLQAPDYPPEPNFEELKGIDSIPETLHLLVVEDNLVNQKVLAKQLRKLGCVVNVANHGGEALEFLKKTNYWNGPQLSSTSPQHLDSPSHQFPATETPATFPESTGLPLELSLILMDWEMPIMNGLTAVAKIRELEQSRTLIGHIPVIGVTANVRQQQIKAAMDAGMDDVVGKPFRVSELLGRMREVVARSVATDGWLERVREGRGLGEGCGE